MHNVYQCQYLPNLISEVLMKIVIIPKVDIPEPPPPPRIGLQKKCTAALIGKLKHHFLQIYWDFWYIFNVFNK